MSFYNNNAASVRPSIKPLRMVYAHMPKENNAYYRPIGVSYDDSIETQLMEDTQGCSNLTHSAVSRVAGRIVQPARHATGIVNIDGGWDSGRFAVFLEAEVNRGSTTSVEVFIGHTDFYGVAGLGEQTHLDPDMRITINSRVILKSTTVAENGIRKNQVLQSKLTNNLNKVGIIDLQGNQSITEESMRPSDLLAGASRTLMHNFKPGMFDSRTAISNLGTISEGDDNQSNRWLSKVLGSYSSALNDQDDLFDDEAITLSHAQGRCNTTSSNAASAIMGILQNETSIGDMGSFTVGELNAVFPDLDAVTQVGTPSGGVIEDSRVQFEDVGGQDSAANIAYRLSHILPTIMSANVYGHIELAISNDTHDGEIRCEILGASPLYTTVIDDGARKRFIVERIRSEVISLIIDESVELFNIIVSAKLVSGNTVRIALNGSHEFRNMRVPNYCNSATSSLLATDTDQVTNLGVKLQDMLGALRDNKPSTTF